MQLLGFKRAPHPPYSPDLAPSDFFLFGHVKGQLSGQSFKTREALLEAIIEKINNIPYSMRWDVFNEWKHRCRWVFLRNGEYFHK